MMFLKNLNNYKIINLDVSKFKDQKIKLIKEEKLLPQIKCQIWLIFINLFLKGKKI